MQRKWFHQGSNTGLPTATSQSPSSLFIQPDLVLTIIFGFIEVDTPRKNAQTQLKAPSQQISACFREADG